MNEQTTPSRRRRALEQPVEDPIAVAIELERQKLQNTPSKRLSLAALAMQALVQAGGTDVYLIAHQAYLLADALIEVEGQ
jgi:hypothetical protein